MAVFGMLMIEKFAVSNPKTPPIRTVRQFLAAPHFRMKAVKVL
jgi:hypothetical protein